MDLNARVDVNCGRTDGRTDGRTENRTPISHLSAKAGATKTYVFLKNNMGISMKKYTIRLFLCRSNRRYNKFCCYKECRDKEGSLMYCGIYMTVLT